MINKIRAVLEEYLNGPKGEPNLADAHDFLMQISDLVANTGWLVTYSYRHHGRPAEFFTQITSLDPAAYLAMLGQSEVDKEARGQPVGRHALVFAMELGKEQWNMLVSVGIFQ